MRKLIFLLMPLALVVSNCDAPAAQTAAAEPANPDKFFTPETTDLPGANGAGNANNPDVKPGDPLSPFNADNSLKPQFPEGVLPRLNALMHRTKDIIDKYDEIRPGIERLVADAKAAPGDTAKMAKANKGIAQIRALQADATVARNALSAEGKKLADSKQYYDEVVFTGMAIFVSRVESEFEDDIKAMGDKVKS
jgi:hypothetical protein